MNKGTEKRKYRDLWWLPWSAPIPSFQRRGRWQTQQREGWWWWWCVCMGGSDSCYIICGRIICLWSRVAFVWTSSESHFLFTSTWTHPWSSTFTIQKPSFNSHMRTGSRVASTLWLGMQDQECAVPTPCLTMTPFLWCRSRFLHSENPQLEPGD